MPRTKTRLNVRGINLLPIFFSTLALPLATPAFAQFCKLDKDCEAGFYCDFIGDSKSCGHRGFCQKTQYSPYQDYISSVPINYEKHCPDDEPSDELMNLAGTGAISPSIARAAIMYSKYGFDRSVQYTLDLAPSREEYEIATGDDYEKPSEISIYRYFVEKQLSRDCKYISSTLEADPDLELRINVSRLSLEESIRRSIADAKTSFNISSQYGVASYYWMEYASCSAKWNEWCEEKFKYTLPKSFNLCKVTYRKSTDRGNTKIEIKKDFNNGSEVARLRLRADGNNELLNRVGAKVKLRNICVLGVPPTAHPSVLKGLKCLEAQSNNRNRRSNNRTGRHAWCSSSKKSLIIAKSVSERTYKVTIKNPNSCRVAYSFKVEYWNPEKNRWITDAYGVTEMSGGDELGNVYSALFQTNWRFSYTYIAKP